LETPELIHAFNGLNTVANSGLSSSTHILNRTFRLNPKTTYLTNTFYNDVLTSAETELKPLWNEGTFETLSAANPVQIVKLPTTVGLKWPANAIDTIRDIVFSIRKANPKAEIAVLSSFVSTAKKLQQSIYPEIGYNDRVTVDTIDRIQGLTVDICMILIPNRGVRFSLNPNRFNVATSRARHHTLLFVPDDLSLVNYDKRIVEYFKRAGAQAGGQDK